jgi:hypothetical protein
MYDCDPLSVQGADSYQETQYDQRLTIDTSFMNCWEPSLSPHSPETPDYLMTSSPVINSSPVPSYASGYSGSFDDVLEKSFGDFCSHFSTFDSQFCGVQQTMSIYDNNNSFTNADTESLYNAFGDRYHHDTHVSPTDLDLGWGDTTLFDPITRTPTRVLSTSHYCCLYYDPPLVS